MKPSRKLLLLIGGSILAAVAACLLFDSDRGGRGTIDPPRSVQAASDPGGQDKLSATLDHANRMEHQEGAAVPPLTVEWRRSQQLIDGASTVGTAVTGKLEMAALGDLEVPGAGFSVVKHPFPVSASILAECEPKPGTRSSLSCEPDMKLLAEMAEESRQEPWASEAERSIRTLVELEPGTDRARSVTYQIRNLECRQTICFLETASNMGRFVTQLYHFEKRSGLRAGYSISTTEIAPDRTQVHVTLWPFVRTQK